jgi:N-acetylmuramoyl-L-alanine amidase
MRKVGDKVFAGALRGRAARDTVAGMHGSAAALATLAVAAIACLSVQAEPRARADGSAAREPDAPRSVGPRSVARPAIVQRPIPFGRKRKREMAAYSRRHYGIDGYLLKDPHVIVEHVTVTSTFQSAWNTFARDVADPELHELPGVCAHFVVDRDGTIYQLVPLAIMCRHTVGLNYTSFGIEHVGMTDSDVLGNRRQMSASLRLSRWLRCQFGIERKNVIGHNESLSSPYHEERVARLRTQTHGDMKRASMRVYRSRLGDPVCN